MSKTTDQAAKTQQQQQQQSQYNNRRTTRDERADQYTPSPTPEISSSRLYERGAERSDSQ